MRHAGSAQVRINLDCGPVNRSMASRATADSPASIGASVRYFGCQLRKSSCSFGCGKAANSLITATALRSADLLSFIGEAISKIDLRNLLASSNCARVAEASWLTAFASNSQRERSDGSSSSSRFFDGR